MPYPRVTIGDGSIYIESDGLLSDWTIHAREIFSPAVFVRITGLEVINVKGPDRISHFIENPGAVDVHFGKDGVLTVQTLSEENRIHITLEGSVKFSKKRSWRRIGDDMLFLDKPRVRIHDVLTNEDDYPQKGRGPHGGPH
jgi:hypothetical protein